MPHHSHGYTWTGPGRMLAAEGDRRPENRERFAASDLPPMIVAHWLLKPPRLLRATFQTPADAVAWLSDLFAEYRPQQLFPDLSTGAAPLPVRARNAEHTLARGGDVCWGWWLKGERFASLAAVSCPNRLHPATPCPTAPHSLRRPLTEPGLTKRPSFETRLDRRAAQPSAGTWRIAAANEGVT